MWLDNLSTWVNPLKKKKDFIRRTKYVTSMFINYKSRELINSVVERREEKVELNNIKQLR